MAGRVFTIESITQDADTEHRWIVKFSGDVKNNDGHMKITGLNPPVKLELDADGDIAPGENVQTLGAYIYPEDLETLQLDASSDVIEMLQGKSVEVSLLGGWD